MDDGDPFDPREVQSDNLEQDLIDRPVGKLGLLLVQKFTEDLEYRALSDGNELTFKLPYPGA